MTIATEERLPRGGVRPNERALAPDLARGIMLLGIVLSNTAFHLWAARRGPSGWQPVDGSWLDHAVQFTMIIVLDLRVYPLFAFLFGYGMMQLYLRQTAAGADGRAAAKILRRRGLWLIAIGLTHAALLMAGDITGFYGVLSLVLGTALLRRGERALKWWTGIGVALLVLVSAGPALAALLRGELGTFGDTGADPGFKAYAPDEADWLTAAGIRLETGLFVTFAAASLTLVGGGYVIFLLGFWAARRRVLEEPGDHRTLLRRTAVLGIAVGWLGALPAALAHTGVLHVTDAMQSDSGALMVLRDITGNAAGLGYVAAIALFAHRWTTRRPRRGATAVAAVASVGQRSLSCYLAHSLLFAPVLAAWGLGLGGHLGSATMALFACAVWLVTLAGAYALERAGRRGPAEAALRRLMYGSRRA
ncbi:DUF418 domain-containing protein [Streptomyces variegatus]|jgi:uncharacterized membrane protein YeiB|uniref:DUF418 domain-containing protein n=1 Tax=Streptomyces variegatus TaxID=284040 RepID=UPI003C2F3A69